MNIVVVIIVIALLAIIPGYLIRLWLDEQELKKRFDERAKAAKEKKP